MLPCETEANFEIQIQRKCIWIHDTDADENYKSTNYIGMVPYLQPWILCWQRRQSWVGCAAAVAASAAWSYCCDSHCQHRHPPPPGKGYHRGRPAARCGGGGDAAGGPARHAEAAFDPARHGGGPGRGAVGLAGDAAAAVDAGGGGGREEEAAADWRPGDALPLPAKEEIRN